MKNIFNQLRRCFKQTPKYDSKCIKIGLIILSVLIFVFFISTSNLLSNNKIDTNNSGNMGNHNSQTSQDNNSGVIGNGNTSNNRGTVNSGTNNGEMNNNKYVYNENVYNDKEEEERFTVEVQNFSGGSLEDVNFYQDSKCQEIISGEYIKYNKGYYKFSIKMRKKERKTLSAKKNDYHCKYFQVEQNQHILKEPIILMADCDVRDAGECHIPVKE